MVEIEEEFCIIIYSSAGNLSLHCITTKTTYNNPAVRAVRAVSNEFFFKSKFQIKLTCIQNQQCRKYVAFVNKSQSHSYILWNLGGSDQN